MESSGTGAPLPIDAGIKPRSIPAGLGGDQLTAYIVGYAAAAAWTDPGAAPQHTGSLRSDLCVSFSRGFNDAVSELREDGAGRTVPAGRLPRASVR